MVDAFTPETFATYFFGNFACIMVHVTDDRTQFWTQDHPPEFWNSVILGGFYVFATPNIPPCPLTEDQTQLSRTMFTRVQRWVYQAFSISEKGPLIVCLDFWFRPRPEEKALGVI